MAEAIQDGAKPAVSAPLLMQEETLTADTFIRGLWKDNPVFVMLLGMCPTLAVTNSTMNALGMGLSTTFVLVFSGILVSLLRHWIPKQVLPTIVNSLGMGVGFTLALLALGTVREILGNGTLLGVSLFGPDFQPWLVMILPPGGFFVLGAWLLLFNWLRQSKVRRAAQFSGASADAR